MSSSCVGESGRGVAVARACAGTAVAVGTGAAVGATEVAVAAGSAVGGGSGVGATVGCAGIEVAVGAGSGVCVAVSPPQAAAKRTNAPNTPDNSSNLLNNAAPKFMRTPSLVLFDDTP